jgi:oligogalacturonide transport system substrate-binding protein
MAARLLYLNQTTWEKAGLPLPDSWDDLLAAGPVFRDRLGKDYYPLDLPFQDVVAISRAWIVQDTGLPLVNVAERRLNASVAQLTAAAQLYQRLVAEHVIPAARERASYGHVAPHEMRPWISGRYGGTYQWISAIGKSADTLEPGQRLVLAPHPLKAGAPDAGLLYRPAMMLAINRHTRHAHEAALLLDFLLNDPEAVRIMGLRRGVPVSARARDALAADGLLHGLAWDGLNQIATLPHGVRESGWFEHARVRDTFTDLFEQLGYGVIDATTAGQRLHDDLNRVLARTIR